MSADEDHTLRIWDWAAANVVMQIKTFKGEANDVTGVRWNPHADEEVRIHS